MGSRNSNRYSGERIYTQGKGTLGSSGTRLNSPTGSWTGSWTGSLDIYGTGSYAGMCATGPTLFGTPTQHQLETYCCLWDCGGYWCQDIDCTNHESTGSFSSNPIGGRERIYTQGVGIVNKKNRR